MYLKLSKFFYLVVLLYYGWYQPSFRVIPNLLLLAGGGMMLMLMIHLYQKEQDLLKPLSGEVYLWAAFVGVAFLSGMFAASHFDAALAQIVVYVQFFILMIGIIYISYEERSVDFFVWTILLLCYLCAATLLLNGQDFKQSGRITLGDENNPNSLGILMCYGMFAALYLHRGSKAAYGLFTFGSIMLFLYTIILTGSRKAIIAAGILLLYWLLFVARASGKGATALSRLRKIVMGGAVLIIGYQLFQAMIGNSVLLERMQESIQYSTSPRLGMYREAWDFFVEHPIFGIGYANFAELSIYGTYSHSTYAEALACTGIVGSLLYFIPYGLIAYKLYRMMRSGADDMVRQNAKLMMGLFLSMLFLGAGMIHFYSFTSNVMFAIMVVYTTLHKGEVEGKGAMEDAANSHPPAVL